MTRRLVIFGAGAIGGVVGAQLARHDYPTVLIQRGTHADAIERDGLKLQHGDETDVFHPPLARTPAEVAWRDDDIVLLTVKSQDTVGALDALALAAPPATTVVCVQNGVDNERVALRYFDNVCGAVAMMPAGFLQDGVVQAHAWPTPGLIDVGRYPSGGGADAQAVVDALNAVGFNCLVRDDVMRWKYTKLLLNLGNAVLALCGLKADGAGELLSAAREEGVAVLDAAGIDYASTEEDHARRGDNLVLVPINGERRTGGSTWQSLARGTGSVETDWLNGEIAALGRLHGVPTPVNAALQRLMRIAARDGLQPESMDAREILASL
jgi:2-dehydropantoate 2-reductase